MPPANIIKWVPSRNIAHDQCSAPKIPEPYAKARLSNMSLIKTASLARRASSAEAFWFGFWLERVLCKTLRYFTLVMI